MGLGICCGGSLGVVKIGELGYFRGLILGSFQYIFFGFWMDIDNDRASNMVV